MLITKGPYASNTYFEINGELLYQLTIDWDNDGVYFTYNKVPIILSIGPKTTVHEYHLLQDLHKQAMLQEMIDFTKTQLRGYSENSDKALDKLVLDSFIQNKLQ